MKEANLLKEGPVSYSFKVPPSKSLTFPSQPHEHLLQFRYDGKLVAYIDKECNFVCKDEEKLRNILISLPKEFMASQEMLRQARLNELKTKYPMLYEQEGFASAE